MAERADVFGKGLFGIILGIIEIIIAAFMFSFVNYWNEMTSTLGSSYSPTYVPAMYGTIGSLITFAGIFVVIHGIKRIVDGMFMAYVKGSERRDIPTTPSTPTT